MNEPLDWNLQRVQEIVRKLAVSAAELNRVSDDLTAALNEIDEALNRLNTGSELWVAIRKSEQEILRLGYAVVEGSWGMAIELVVDPLSAFKIPPRQWRIRNSPRIYRVDAVAYIPILLKALADYTETQIKSVKQAAEIAADMVSGLVEGDGKTDA